MRTKPQRWYETIDGIAYVYEHPYKSQSISVSVVPCTDLKYYRNNFNLSKIWGIRSTS